MACLLGRSYGLRTQSRYNGLMTPEPLPPPNLPQECGSHPMGILCISTRYASDPHIVLQPSMSFSLPDGRGYRFVRSNPWASGISIIPCGCPECGLQEVVEFLGHAQICDMS